MQAEEEKSRGSGRRRHVAGGLFRAAAEEEVFHLARQILAGARIGQVQAILVDEHGLVPLPGLERLLADVVVDALAELARVDGEVEAFGLALEVDALDGACHGNSLFVRGGCAWRARAGWIRDGFVRTVSSPVPASADPSCISSCALRATNRGRPARSRV